MAEQMRAVTIDAFGDPRQAHVALLPKPKPGPGEVLVKVESSPINPSDLIFMMGMYGSRPLPAVPGLEGSGTVVESGEGEHAAALVGKRVQLSGNGLWAEYKLVKADDCVPLIDSVDFDLGSTLYVNPMTVLMFRDLIRSGNHRAAVQDAANSALGKMLNRICRLDGVPLINVVRSAKSAEALRAEGTENVLDSSAETFAGEYRTLCERLGATIAFDAVAGDTTGILLSGLCAGGVVHVYGGLSGQPSNGLKAGDVIFLRKRVEGKMMPGWLSTKTAEEKRDLFDEIQRHIHDIFRSEFVGHFTLEQIQDALRTYTTNMSAGKVLVHPGRQ